MSLEELRAELRRLLGADADLADDVTIDLALSRLDALGAVLRARGDRLGDEFAEMLNNVLIELDVERQVLRAKLGLPTRTPPACPAPADPMDELAAARARRARRARG